MLYDTLKTVLSNKKGVDNILTRFDGFLSLKKDLYGIKTEMLPKEMRLTPYFVELIGSKSQHFYIKADCSLGLGVMPRQSGSFEHKGRTAISIDAGDVRFEHYMITYHDEPFIAEKLEPAIEIDEGDPHVSLHSGTGSLITGHDCHELDSIGSVIFVDEEDFFKKFVAKNCPTAPNYSIQNSRYELAIVPTRKVTKRNFIEMTNGLVEITNTILERLEQEYSKKCKYLKIPKKCQGI